MESITLKSTRMPQISKIVEFLSNPASPSFRSASALFKGPVEPPSNVWWIAALSFFWFFATAPYWKDATARIASEHEAKSKFRLPLLFPGSRHLKIASEENAKVRTSSAPSRTASFHEFRRSGNSEKTTVPTMRIILVTDWFDLAGGFMAESYHSPDAPLPRAIFLVEKLRTTLRGDHIVQECQTLLDNSVATHHGQGAKSEDLVEVL